MKNIYTEDDFTPYMGVDWSGICEDYDLKSGDISPHQTLAIEEAYKQINKVLIEFVQQNES